MARIASQQMMECETRVTFGPAPHSLTHEPLRELHHQMVPDEFLLRGVGHHYFHYRQGAGVTIERGPDADLSEEVLWLNGSVHAAVASMNGLFPIHASAVAINGTVFAFAGPGGAGKSTLVAALGDRGLPMFCDDTLVLDLVHPDGILCLPGHKRLKLTPAAFALTGAAQEEKVSRTVGKFYARPAAGNVLTAMPLAQLIFLEEGGQPHISAISGADRFLRAHDDHYTATLFATAGQFDRAARFAHLCNLARQIDMARFVRPRDEGRFGETADIAFEHVMRVASALAPAQFSCVP